MILSFIGQLKSLVQVYSHFHIHIRGFFFLNSVVQPNWYHSQDVFSQGWLQMRYQSKQGVCHTVALPFTLKHILRQKKNYANSNISPSENTILKKSSKRNQNPSRYYNSITNLKFQHKPKYHLSKILIKKQTYHLVPKPLKLLIFYNETKHNILAVVGKANKVHK